MGNCSTKSKMSSTVKLDARLVFSLDFERAPACEDFAARRLEYEALQFDLMKLFARYMSRG